MKKEAKKTKENKKKNKLPLIIGVIILIIVAGIIGFIILNHHNNSIKGQFDKILSSNKTEVIFFERKGNTESDQFKELLDNDLKEQGVWICGTDMDTNTIYTKQDYKMPLAIVIGSEGFGMSRLVKENCDFLVKIPMKGKITSLNASVSAGIVLYEVVKQRL